MFHILSLFHNSFDLISIFYCKQKVLFKETEVIAKTPKGLETRECQFKGSEFKFVQYKSRGNKSWETGVWKKKLENIITNKVQGVKFTKSQLARANYVLERRSQS